MKIRIAILFPLFILLFLAFFAKKAHAYPTCGVDLVPYTYYNYSCSFRNGCSSAAAGKVNSSGDCDQFAKRWLQDGVNTMCGFCKTKGWSCSSGPYKYDPAYGDYGYPDCQTTPLGNGGSKYNCSGTAEPYFCGGTPACSNNSDCAGSQICQNGKCVTQPSCNCGSWSNGACGAGSCGNNERQQTRNCTPNNCLAETRCLSSSASNCSTSCTCTSWTNGACGGGSCANNRRLQTRTCPSNCDTETQCLGTEYSSCGVTPTPPPPPPPTPCNSGSGINQTCIVTGDIYIDKNGNGTRNPAKGENVWPSNIVVRIWRGSSGCGYTQGCASQKESFTFSDGNYKYYNEPAGNNYHLQICKAGTTSNQACALPNGYVCTTGNCDNAPLTFNSNNEIVGIDFGIKQNTCTTYDINGHIFRDDNANGSKNSGEPYLDNTEVKKWRNPSAGLDEVDCNGSVNFENQVTPYPPTDPGGYIFWDLEDGSNYQIKIVPDRGYECTSISGTGGTKDLSTCTVSNIPLTQNRTYDFGVRAPSYDITGTVYIDSNNNHAIDGGDDRYRGGTTLTVVGSNPVRSDTSSTANGSNGGSYTISNNPNGAQQVSISGLTSGYTVDPNYSTPQDVDVNGADTTLNFLVDLPTYTINGNVFIDDGGTQGSGGIANNGIKDGNEANVPDAISMSGTGRNSNPPTVALNTCPQGPGGADYCLKTGASAGGSGRFTVDKLRTTENNVSLSYSPSALYYSIWPTPPNISGLQIGNASATACAAQAYRDKGTLCQNGNINNLNFAVRYAEPWLQTVGADIRWNGPYNNPQPISTFNSIPLVVGGVTKADEGIIYMSGDSAAPFGAGAASPKGWNVRNQFYPSDSKYIRTSYSSYLERAKRNTTINDIAQMQTNADPNARFCASGTPTGNCVPRANLPKGVYSYAGNLSLGSNTAGASYTFGASCSSTSPSTSCAYTILVNGNVTINSELKSPRANRTILIISASGSISVAPGIGAASPNSATAHLEGVFSADGFFNAGTGTLPDKRLNIAGAVVGNADGVAGGGGINPQRDLLAENKNYPAFTATERPDFLANYPKELKEPSFNWTEQAP